MADDEEQSPLIRNDEHFPITRRNNTDQRNEESEQHYGTWDDPHSQFCSLIGIPPSDRPPNAQRLRPKPKSLYARATSRRKAQNFAYTFTAALANTLLLSQVVLGAALTGLGASRSSHVLITVFGALNTVIAGLITYLKSRGEPMRSRMFRDDLDRVVDEIENSEIMWLGIAKKVSGYDEMEAEDEFSVRSEVARLTRLYERAVRYNALNNPDNYFAGGNHDGTIPGMGARQSAGAKASGVPGAPTPAPATSGVAAAPVDESPATARKLSDIHNDTVKKDAEEPTSASPPRPSSDGDKEPPATNGKSNDDTAVKNKENVPPPPQDLLGGGGPSTEAEHPDAEPASAP